MGIKTDYAHLEEIKNYVNSSIDRVKDRVVKELTTLNLTLEEIYTNHLFDDIPPEALSAIIYLEVYASVRLAIEDILCDREGTIYDLTKEEEGEF